MSSMDTRQILHGARVAVVVSAVGTVLFGALMFAAASDGADRRARDMLQHGAADPAPMLPDVLGVLCGLSLLVLLLVLPVVLVAEFKQR